MTSRTFFVILFGVISLTYCFPAESQARRPQENIAVQVLLGAADYDNDGLTFESSSTDPTVSAESDLSQMPMLGVVGHLPFDNDKFNYGMEAGLLFGWRRRDVSAYSNLNTTVIRVDTSLNTLDMFVGLFWSRVIGGSTRVFVGAGPSMMFADYDGDQDEDDGSGNTTTVDTSESAFGIGGYARAGVEFRLRDGSMMGLCVRGVRNNLDFSHTKDQDVTGVQAFITYSRGFSF